MTAQRRYGLDRRAETVVLFDFEEVADVPPVDVTENLAALTGDVSTTPDLELGAIVTSDRGRARSFDKDKGGTADEAVVGAALLLRNCTIRVVMKYAIAAASDTDIGTVVLKGDGNSAAERTVYGLELVRVNSTTVKLRALWSEVGGTPATIAGVNYAYIGDEMYLVCVREWIDTTTVNVRYYVDGELVGSEVVTDGDIGEGATGRLLVGCFYEVLGPNYERFLPTGSYVAGLAIDSDAICTEEIRQEYRRMVIHQPAGQAMLRANLPPGTTYATDPTSLVQMAIAADGDGLGQIVALAEQMREDWPPTRAYGAHLEAWELITGRSPKPTDTIAERRTAVLGFLRKTLGFPIGDIKLALEPLFDLDSADIEIVEFTGLRTDDFDVDDITTPPSTIWSTRPGNGTIAVTAGVCQFVVTAGTAMAWLTTGGPGPFRETSVSARNGEDVDGATFVCSIDTLNFPSDSDVVYGHIWRDIAGNCVVIGKRWNVVDGYEHIAWFEVIEGVQGAITDIDPGAAIDPQFLLTRYDSSGNMTYEYADSFAELKGVGTAISVSLDSPRWCGMAVIGTDASLASDSTINFDDAKIFEPKSPRGFAWIAYRDPALSGNEKIVASQQQLDKQKPAHTIAEAATHKLGFKLGPGGEGRLGVSPLYPALP